MSLRRQQRAVNTSQHSVAAPQLVTRFWAVTSWPCDQLTGSPVFTDANMSQTMLAWVSTGFCRIMPTSQLTDFKLHNFWFKFTREVFPESGIYKHHKGPQGTRKWPQGTMNIPLGTWKRPRGIGRGHKGPEKDHKRHRKDHKGLQGSTRNLDKTSMVDPCTFNSCQ